MKPGADLRAWISHHLDPIADGGTGRPYQSDFDLNPDMDPGDIVVTPAAVLVPLIERPEGFDSTSHSAKSIRNASSATFMASGSDTSVSRIGDTCLPYTQKRR